MKKKGYINNSFTKINNLLLKNKFLRKIKNVYYYLDGFMLLFIKKPKNRIENKKKKVFIIFNLFLGDGAIFYCSLKNIREIYPRENYEITIACQNGLSSIYEETKIFDKVIPLNFTKFAINLNERRKLFKYIRKDKYDILLDPIGIEECSISMLVSRAVCADKKIGIVNYGRDILCPKRFYKKIYNNLIEINNRSIHILEHYFEFFNKIGNFEKNIKYEKLPSKKPKLNLPNEYFIINPSASTEYKKWPVDRYAEIAKKIYKKIKIPLIICGTDTDKSVNEKLINFVKDSVEYIDLTGKTTVLEYIYLIQKSKYVVTNDTGSYHIAVISEVPVTIPSGQYTYDRFLIYDFKNYQRPYIANEKKIDCADCNNICCKTKQMENVWPCLDAISTEEVWKKVEEMINKNEVKDEKSN